MFEFYSRGDFTMFVSNIFGVRGPSTPDHIVRFAISMCFVGSFGTLSQFGNVLRFMFESKTFATFMFVETFVQVVLSLLH